MQTDAWDANTDPARMLSQLDHSPHPPLRKWMLYAAATSARLPPALDSAIVRRARLTIEGIADRKLGSETLACPSGRPPTRVGPLSGVAKQLETDIVRHLYSFNQSGVRATTASRMWAVAAARLVAEVIGQAAWRRAIARLPPGDRAVRPAGATGGRRAAPGWAPVVIRDLYAASHDLMVRAEQAVQAAVARDVFGNAARPVPFDARLRTSTVLGLAAAAYRDRAFDRLPILADALEEAGCDDVRLLAHCRGTEPHARGCWVVDLILGYEFV